MTDVHKLLSCLVDLLHLKVVVYHDQSIGAVFDNGIGKAFCFFLQERQAHGNLGLALIDGNRFFPAGVVAAGTAVQLVFRLCFAHFPQDFPELSLIRHTGVPVNRGEFLPDLCDLRLHYVKVLFAGIICHGHIIAHRASVILFHDRASDTASRAGGHLNEAVMDIAVFNVLKGRDAVFHTVNGQIGVPLRIQIHCFQNTAGGGEQARLAFFVWRDFLFQLYMLPVQPLCQLLKGQHRIHKPCPLLGLVLFGYAGPDKHCFCLRYAPLDIHAVCLHRREHICQIHQLIREVLADQQIDGVTAGGDDNIAGIFLKHAVIFALDHCCPVCCFLYIGEAELFQSLTHGFDPDAVIIRYKGRRQAGNDRGTAVQQNPYFFGFTDDFLCSLGADDKTMPAEYAFVTDDVCLPCRESNRFHRTVPDAFVTVLAV